MAQSPRSFSDLVARYAGRDPTVLAVVGVTLGALLLRFVFLGDRVAHWDEARVAYWTLNYLETGEFHYRFIIHGPFVQIVNRPVFALLGANDFTMRAVVALVGGLLPLAALLLREHLRPSEVVGLALLLAANPILLYYSRFFRSSVLVAAFMFTAFGSFVRAYDSRNPRFVHVGVVLVVLGFAAKENAAIYLLVWVGAAVLLVDTELFRPYASTTGLGRLRSAVGSVLEAGRSPRTLARRYLGHGLLAGGLFALVIVFFYAPRTADPAGTGLWQAVAHPGRFPAVIDLMVEDLLEGFRYWFGGATDPGCNQSNVIDSYLCFLGRSLEVLAGFGAVVTAFGVGGFLYERYAVDRPRPLVMFASYWGFASLLGYPLGADIFGAWFLVNVVVPFAVPAAVALATVYRWGLAAWADGDRVSANLAALVLVLVIGQIGAAGLSGVFLQPQSPDNGIVQYAQPAGDFRPELREINRLSGTSSGPDVLLYGEWLVDGDTEAVRQPACADWFNALPLPWYIAANDWSVACATNHSELTRQLERNPTVVITRANRSAALREAMAGYTATTYAFRTSKSPPPPEVTFYRRTAATESS